MTTALDYLAARVEKAAGAAWAGALDLVLPPRCPVTHEFVARQGDLSPEGWDKLYFIDKPYCDLCGVPFSHEVGEGAICASCAAQPHVISQNRSALVYDDASRNLVLGFKHGDRLETAAAFGRWMARAGEPFWAEADWIAPTPLHWRRLMKRRFNQAAVLAQEIARVADVPLAVDMLARTRSTPPQGGLSPTRRQRNVAGAFEVRKKWLSRIEGARIVLVDDVFTTGATLDACARVLKRAGAAEVSAVTLARVVKDGSAAI